jgi:hypothetical protein
MPEYVVVAGVTAMGYLAMVLRTWVRVRGTVQREKAHGAFRRDVVRELPQGSRLVDTADQLIIEVGAGRRTPRRSV